MVPQILLRVGLPAMADWLLHLAGLAAYTFLHWDVQVGWDGGCAGGPGWGVQVGVGCDSLGRAGELACSAGRRRRSACMHGTALHCIAW